MEEHGSPPRAAPADAPSAGAHHARHEQHEEQAHHRGVTRPAHDHAQHGHEPTPRKRRTMARQHHRQTLWVDFTLVILGLWLLTGPVTFGYADGPMLWSDLASGVLLVVLGLSSVPADRPWIRWAACFVGVWLQFAPLLFWAESPAAYLNDTLVGALVIALTILIPGMPGMIRIMKPGPQIPPGWTYNPSSWPQRAIMIGLGFAGWLVSRYLAAFQLGYIDHAWDPFFGEGSRRVLNSDMSKAWPISDAGLGATSYTFEMLMGFMGGVARWRTMPWMVLFFGILVVPLGLTHIVLVMSQPVVVGEWCTLCLLAAAIMLPMIPLTLDEVIAMCQFMLRSRREGKPFWRTFWLGGTTEGGGPDERSPMLNASPAKVAPAMFWGFTPAWPLIASAAVGLWLMFAPAAFGSTGAAAHSDQLTGAFAIVVAVIAMAEVARPFRLLNIPAGLWLLVAGWILDGADTAAAVSSAIAGLALIALSIPRGTIRDRYGAWDRYIR